MITGHLATALVAKRAAPAMPWWLLAVAAMLIDIAMFTLVGLGVEQMVPNPEASGPTLATTVVEMTYSHDLIPQVFWIGVSGALAYLVTRNRQFTLIAMMLTGAHWLGDLVAGYGHFVFGPESHALGTDWYHLNLPAALGFEAALGVACVYWFTRGHSFSLGVQVALYGVFGLLPFAFLII